MPDVLTELMQRARAGTTFTKSNDQTVNKDHTTDARKAGLSILDRVFGGEELPSEIKDLNFARPDIRLRGFWNLKPEVFQREPEMFTKTNVHPYGRPEEYDEDPSGELAVLLAKRSYPKAMSRVASVRVGEKQEPSRTGFGGQVLGRASYALDGTPIVRMAPISKDYGYRADDSLSEATGTLMHELGHVMGLGDNWRSSKFSSAYDISSLMDMLNSDITLPDPRPQERLQNWLSAGRPQQSLPKIPKDR